MQDEIKNLWEDLKSRTKKVLDEDELNKLKSEFVGKKGEVTKLLRDVGGLAEEEKKVIGKAVNQLKEDIFQFIEQHRTVIKDSLSKQRHLADQIDVTLPHKEKHLGFCHPLTRVLNEVVDFFQRRGFVAVSGPEIESDYYNFEALNIPEDHPARATQDSFYLKDRYLLRTQTSNMQIRVAEKTKPPIAIISPGKVFRRDTIDATHSYFFHQMEGMLIDEHVGFGDLKGILYDFCLEMFGDQINVRFRPDFFPFTEPSCEVAIEYAGRSEGWLEILGAGSINPLVLKNMNINPKRYSAFAFGIGIERIAMIRYGIDDIRLFYENDLSFLRQFS